MRATIFRGLTLTMFVSVCFAAAGVSTGAAEGLWTAGIEMPTARSELAVTRLHGRIYVAGGIGQWGTSKAFEVYDPGTSSWQRLAPLPKATHHAALAAADGRIYLSGGYPDLLFSRIFRSAWRYDPKADKWARITDMPGPRAAHRLVALEGKIYVVGGRGPDSTALWVYDPKKDRWDASRSPLPTAREHLATAVAGGKLYAIGGRLKDHVNRSVVEAYYPATDQWLRRSDLPAARGGHTAAALNGRIHVTGGEDITAGKVFAEHWVYDPTADRWDAGPPMPTARHGTDSAAYGDEWYVIGGGTAAGWCTLISLSDRVEVYSAP
jgi:N-acetylneuraminic acid mutarotase